MENPFPTGIPVTGKDLIGRKKEITEITELLKTGQSVVLIAPRRYGKTSIMIQVLKNLRNEGFFTGEIDIFRISNLSQLSEAIIDTVVLNKKINNFVHIIKEKLSEAFKKVEFKQVIEDFEFVLSLKDKSPNIDDILEKALDFPEKFAQKYKSKFIMGYDEISDIMKLDGEQLLKKMRSYFQKHKNTSYIFAGSLESAMNELFANKKHAFYRFARIYNIGNIERNVFKTAIKNKFKKNKTEITNDALDKVLNLTEGHPYYTQLICQLLYFENKVSRIPIQESHVDGALNKAILNEKGYFDEIWSRMRGIKNALAVLKALVLKKSPYRLENVDRQSIYYTLTMLINTGFLKRVEKNVYKITDPLFEIYLLRVFQNGGLSNHLL
ncbi:ATP-binding protein [bacterium]|nr:ATP-binding protein [bacterium]